MAEVTEIRLDFKLLPEPSLQVGYRHIPNAHKGQVKEEGRDANGDYEGPQTKQDDLFVRNDVPLFKEQPIATRESKQEL